MRDVFSSPVWIAVLAAACASSAQRQKVTREQIEERIQWSRSEMETYNASCRGKQAAGVKPEEANHFCACKTLGLAVKFSSPAAAENTLPTDADREIYARTGNAPRMIRVGFADYARVVDLCKTSTRKKYGVPEVSLEEF